MSAEPAQPKKAAGRAFVPWQAAVISGAVHALLVTGAAFVTVMVIQSRQKVMFEAKPSPSVPARKLEHSIRVKQVQQQARKPQILQRLLSQSPSSVSLPDLPKLDAQSQKLRDTPVLNTKAGNLLGGLGTDGGGSGRGLTGGSGYSDTKFFGENVRTRAICILVDVSQSIVEKGVLEDCKREAAEMLKNLSTVTKFNLVAFVDGAQPFSPQMVFATQDNKAKGLEWLGKIEPNKTGNRSGFSGSTPSEAIRVATEMGCDTMFVISDDPPYLKEGSAWKGTEIATHPDDILDFARSIDTKFGRQVKINTIVYKPRPNEMGERSVAFYKKLAQVTGGRFRLVKK